MISAHAATGTHCLFHHLLPSKDTTDREEVSLLLLVMTVIILWESSGISADKTEDVVRSVRREAAGTTGNEFAKIVGEDV
jgi:hypothetical protein